MMVRQRRRRRKGIPMASRTDFIGQVFLGGESSATFKRRVRKARKRTIIAIGKGAIASGKTAKKIAQKASKSASRAKARFKEFQRKRRNILETKRQERQRQESMQRDFFE